MNAPMVAPATPKVNDRRFVPAKEPTEQTQVVQGRQMYYSGKPLAACVTDEQAQGWLAAEAKCEAQYWQSMMAQASDREVM